MEPCVKHDRFETHKKLQERPFLIRISAGYLCSTTSCKQFITIRCNIVVLCPASHTHTNTHTHFFHNPLETIIFLCAKFEIKPKVDKQSE